MQTFQQNAYPTDDYAKEFGISVNTRMMEVESRVLPAPLVSASLCIRSISVRNVTPSNAHS